MGSYVPHTEARRREMLAALGLESVDALFADIPSDVRLQKPVALPYGMSQMETARAMEELAARNTRYATVLRGAGSYDHFIPPIVTRVTGKEEFVTAYTPYQAELSQGVLQSIFEYQTLMCELCGMDVSNASVYDGATAAAEAAAMCRERGRSVALVSAGAHPDTIATLRTYGYGANAETRVAPLASGATDAEALADMLTPDVACRIVQQPNFYGVLEDVKGLFTLAKAAGVKCVLVANPMALALLPGGREVGADVVCGDAQPLGMPMAFGGPSLGFMTATSALVRRLPGRIVGETVDHDQNRAFVLTLQAREQHIRREKAQSNICSNQAHCALTAAAYLTAMGRRGLEQVAQSCLGKAHYLARRLCEIEGVSLPYGEGFFHEFVTALPVAPETVERALEDAGVLSGLPLDESRMLWCVTEKAERKTLDRVAGLVREACGR